MFSIYKETTPKGDMWRNVEIMAHFHAVVAEKNSHSAILHF